VKNKNLYFDNAATSWPKPESVYLSAEKYLRNIYGNPGRTGNTRSLEANRLLYNAREQLASFFNSPDPSQFVFTLNATDALNMAIKGVLDSGDHVIFTSMEHNSVLRPIGSLHRQNHIETTMIPADREGNPDLNFYEQSFRPHTKLVVCNHASNVLGTLLPVDIIIEIAHRRGALVLVDAAQTSGVLPINLDKMNPDLMAFAGHKGLLGPPGSGGLYVRKGIKIKPWREGGTGSHSDSDQQPENMPERLEAGTLNGPGIAGLIEGIKYINKIGLENIRHHDLSLLFKLRKGLEKIPGLKLHGPSDYRNSVAVLSFTIDNIDCGEIGDILENSFGIICRTGLHCAPLAHQAAGTFPEGTIRLSPGHFTTDEDIEFVLQAVQKISSSKI
jgi:cysteine desulfurase family protein